MGRIGRLNFLTPSPNPPHTAAVDPARPRWWVVEATPRSSHVGFCFHPRNTFIRVSRCCCCVPGVFYRFVGLFTLVNSFFSCQRKSEVSL